MRYGLFRKAVEFSCRRYWRREFLKVQSACPFVRAATANNLATYCTPRGTLYSTPISVSSNASLQAIAYESGMADSAISSVTYTISGGSGPPWYNTGWSYRKPITIAYGQVSGASSLINFPMDVSWASDSNLSAGAQSSGNDILFTASDGVTKLNHEIEQYTSSTGQLASWVQIPSLSPTANTVIYMYYGNSSASNQQNAASVWDSNYKGVWHLPQNPTGSAPQLLDSTSNAYNLTVTTGSAGAATSTGQIGGAVSFPMTNEYSPTYATNSGNLAIGGTNTYTVSGWFKVNSFITHDAGYFSLFGSGGPNPNYETEAIVLNDTGTLYYRIVNNYTFGGLQTGNTSAISTSTWNYVVGTNDGTTLKIYLNGNLAASVSSSGDSISNNPFAINGVYPYAGGNAQFDEVRASNSTRSAPWILTEYNNQSSPGTFFSVGAAQGQGGGSYPAPVATPTFSPAPGTYNASQTVTVTSGTSGASIRYTIDGTTPSETAGTLYSGAIAVSATTTIKTIAYKSGMADSEIAAGIFTISSSSGGGDYLTYYTYDAWDNLSQVSMPRPSGTQTRTFTYNGKLLMSATNPENGTVTYTYNGFNKVATKTDAKGQVFSYAYDGYARLTGVTVNGNQLETYTYDTTQNSTYPNYSLGRLTAVQYSGVTETYGYNQAGQKTNKGLKITQTLTEQGSDGNNHTGPATLDLESVNVYDTEGKMTSIQYPNSGPNFGYGYDTMSRLSTMTNIGQSIQVITGTTYDPANRLLSISGSLTESRTYNVMGQLTQLSSGPSLNITYNYSSTQNNGKITSQTDNLSGEQVVYAYDALNRLASAGATNNSWGQSYVYDGFGNLLDQNVTAGTAPSLSVVYNAATNRQTTDCADANGNVGCGSQQTYGYDAKNRISTVSLTGGGQMFYTYAPDNKRVWRNAYDINGIQTLSEVTFWSVTGQKLIACNLTPGQAVYQNQAWVETLNCSGTVMNAYFGRKLLGNGTGNVTQDRLGSIGKFYPWGQEKPSATTNGTEKFAGYFRDAETGLDYAVNRYHQPGMGRFLSADPYMASGGPSDPGSWNRYSYVEGDPVNFKDPTGEYMCNPANPQCTGAASFGLCDPYDPICGNTCGPGQFFNPYLGYCQTIPGGGQGFGAPAGAAGAFAGTAHSPGGAAGPSGYAADIAILQQASKDCLKDLKATSAAQAVSALQNSTITYNYGPTPILNASENITNGATPAQTTGTSGIILNLNFGWLTPSNVNGLAAGGGAYLFNMTQAVGNSIGVPDLTDAQYHELILLHELGHLLGTPQDSLDSPYNTNIFNDCIKGQ